MNRREDYRPLQWGPDYRSFRQMDGQRCIAWHENIRVECLALLPRVGKGNHRIAIILDDGRQCGVFERDTITAFLQVGRTPTTGKEC